MACRWYIISFCKQSLQFFSNKLNNIWRRYSLYAPKCVNVFSLWVGRKPHSCSKAKIHKRVKYCVGSAVTRDHHAELGSVIILSLTLYLLSRFFNQQEIHLFQEFSAPSSTSWRTHSPADRPPCPRRLTPWSPTPGASPWPRSHHPQPRTCPSLTPDQPQQLLTASQSLSRFLDSKCFILWFY